MTIGQLPGSSVSSISLLASVGFFSSLMSISRANANGDRPLAQALPEAPSSSTTRDAQQKVRLCGTKLTRWEWIGDAHHHLLCRHCGLVVELDDEPFRKLAGELARSRGVRVDVRHLALPGLCPACAACELS